MRFLIIICLLGLLAACGTTTNTASTPRSTATPAPTAAPATECPNAPGPINGPIVFGMNGNLMAIGADGSGLTTLTTLGETRAATDPAWSPDGKTLAFTLTRPSKDVDLAWLPVSMICGLDRATGQARTLAQAVAVNDSFTEPSWASDGQSLLVTAHQPIINELKQYTGDLVQLAQVILATQAVKPLLKNGKSPAIAPDDSRLVYIENNPDTFISRLMSAQLDGSNAQPLDQANTNFLTLNAPLWSPDATQIIFAGALGSTGQRSTLQWAFDTLLGVEVAEAHGTPAEIWLIDPKGTNLRALTDVQLDDPRMAWSPDSKQIAYTGGQNGGIFLLNLTGGSPQQITTQGNYGGITWRR